MNGLYQYFAADERFKDTVQNWDELAQEPDFGKFVGKVVEASMKKREKEIKAAAEKQSRAWLETALAKHHISLPVPMTKDTAPAQGGSTLTYEAYTKMTPEQAAKFSSDEIDEMYRRHREGR